MRAIFIVALLCLLFSLSAVNFPHANAVLTQDNIVLSENFESGTLDPGITVHTTGTFSSNPGIKSISNFGSTKAFGFGRSTCSASCFSSFVTTLRITLPAPTFVSDVSFKEMELFDNWGSQGILLIDGVRLTDSPADFGRLPINDRQPDTTFRPRSFTINRSVTIIELRVEDITNLSEIYIDDLVITGTKAPTPSPTPTPNLNVVLYEDFESGTLDSRISISTTGSISSAPGIKPIPNFGSTKAFGFGLSTCPFNCFLNHVATLRITLPTPTFISNISFREMELFDNWGSLGKVFIDGVLLSDSDFGRRPFNDRQPDTKFRSRSFTINRSVTIIELRVEDITNLSEIYIDDLVVIGDAPVAFQITAVSPNSGGNTGTVTATVRGSGLQPGAVVRLRDGNQVVVTGQNPIVTLQTRIQTTFDLQGQTARTLTLEVINPDGASATIPQGFTIEDGRPAQLWVDVVGLNTIRSERSQTFLIFYGNRGNVDAHDVFLRAFLPGRVEVRGGIPKIEDPTIDYGAIPESVTVDAEEVIPVWFLKVPGGAAGVIAVSIEVIGTAGEEIELRAELTQVPSEFSTTGNIDLVDESPTFRAFEDAILAASTELPDAPTRDAVRSTLRTGVGIIWNEFLGGVAIGVGGGSLIGWAFGQPLLGAIIGGTVGGLVSSALSAMTFFMDRTFDSFEMLHRETAALRSRFVGSFDPNDKIGTRGAGELGFIAGEERVPYIIYFENLETATAPAQEVVITDQLDTSKLDLSTFSLGPIAFGNKRVIPPPGASAFVTDVDLRPAKNLIVRIIANLNLNTGLMTWRFSSLDPVTGNPPEDPLLGFLPPNKVPPEGDGNVGFTVTSKMGLSTGTEIRNQARILFDTNAPVDTPVWRNAIDNTEPTSRVMALAASQPAHSFVVNWSGTDVGSGISSFNIFVSENGGAFSLWETNVTATSAVFYGRTNTTYGFYSIATDLVGNQEPLKTAAESTTITPAGNPIGDPRWFVRQHYLDFLNREPDAPGLAFWSNEISSCGSDQTCIEIKRINVSAAFYLSIEFQQTGYLVERLYKTAYGDATGTSTLGGTHQLSVPIIRLNEFFPETQEISLGVVVGQPGWQTVLENNKQAFTAEFVRRSRFITAFPTSMTPAQFVDKLNSNAGNPLSSAERNQLINDLTTGAKTRAQVLRAVAENQNLVNSEFNRAFVLMQYYGYLRRNPDDPQDTDFTGYDFWLTKLNQFNGNFINAEMVKAFISSLEYRNRFGQ